MKRAALWALRLAGTVATVAAAAPARADGTGDIEGLLDQPVLSAASKSAETATTAPATSTTITAEELRRYGIRSLNEAINFLSLGMVTTNPLHSVEIGARGVLLTGDYGNHVLVLVDGHAMNEQYDDTTYFERGIGIPFELIDHIEVILGPGSVLYGGNAMLGVINIVTKRAKDYKGVHLIAESEIPISYRLGGGAGAEFKLFGQRSEFTFQLEDYVQSGPRFTYGPQLYGDDSITGAPKTWGPGSTPGVWGGQPKDAYYSSVPAAYGRFVLGNLEVKLHASTYKRATPYLDSLSNSTGDFNEADNYELDRFLSVDVSHQATLSSALQLHSRIYGDSYDYQWFNSSSAAEDCLANQNNGCRRHLVAGSQWAGIELQPSIDWLHDQSVVTMFGIEGRIRRIRSKFDVTDLVTGDNPGSTQVLDQTQETGAAYLQQTVRPASWLWINAGARGDLDPRFDNVKFSPRAAIGVSPWNEGWFKVIFAEAFRAPTSYELTFADPGTEVVADQLKPESVRGVEGSFEQRFGSQRIFVGAFRSWWSNVIAYAVLTPAEVDAAIAAGQLVAGTTYAYQYRNVESIDNYGFNAAYDGSLASSRLRYGINVTGAYSRKTGPDPNDPTQTVREALTVGPSIFGNARISYDFGGLLDGLPTLALAGQLLGSRPADRAFDGGFTPQPFVSTYGELRLTISGIVPGVKGLSYRATANYATGGQGPYVIGPVQYALPTQPEAQLSPVDRFRTGIGLQYDFFQ